ncbi:hypothetical protein HPB50_020179 [Hyalomma asiaticum]|uniref:Uncharacterized protein n=1 Tax=Hyalomma asiaticum TaxID=266040 RepID=A0ACB7TQG8_HYAAI|nr:hypothetical protein HPB50_020179 [Hyalomma asiaticum]
MSTRKRSRFAVLTVIERMALCNAVKHSPFLSVDVFDWPCSRFLLSPESATAWGSANEHPGDHVKESGVTSSRGRPPALTGGRPLVHGAQEVPLVRATRANGSAGSATGRPIEATHLEATCQPAQGQIAPCTACPLH